ncbi:6-hydroxymethylpterin diphosphokinase MptE-like protein [Sinorhizobium alkalisoli]|uniref:6-hydroxymethylpterin diphosphokinase MptE-like domain-containing protein n=1 Tax=Sinorhizobium alkalisoli TaxID=1752398 RepID=A0A1E3V4A8_9HYPH|nr:6-hydroxymethylpterin diphosphokinase MptE-like protein [Sinorhizobium alkalisoli]ODR88360.1 hypothetical protein A8M32_25460 [Sinorhizobium alkalisoli]
MDFRLQNYVSEFGETILNAFDVGSWRRATTVKDVRLSILAYRGAGSVILRHFSAIGTVDIETLNFTGSGAKSTEWINLSTVDGFLLPVFVAGTEEFEAACEFQTRTPPRNAGAKTNYISCTFRRAAYIQKNAEIFGRYVDKHRQVTQAKLTVVDNGGDSGVRETADVYVFQNENLGGAGGFGRGMYETCYGALKDEGFTHICLMDDDIYLHPEMFFRNDMLVKYMKPNVHLGAPMYPASFKSHIPDRVSCFGHRFKGGHHPSDEALGAGLRTANIGSFLKLNRNPDSTGWWWNCIAIADVKKVGMPYPLFVKMDDVEYSLRLQDKGVKLVIPTSLWVLHDDFEEKYSAVMQYFRFRNRWILQFLRGGRPVHQSFVAHLRKTIVGFIMARKYEHATLLIRGLQDVLKGPEHVANNTTEILEKVLSIVKVEKNVPMIALPKGVTRANGRKAPRLWVERVFNMLTLNSHYSLRNEHLVIDTTSKADPTAVRKGLWVTYWNSHKKVGFKVKRNPKRAYRLFLRMRRTLPSAATLYDVAAQFRSSHARMTSPKFWAQYSANKSCRTHSDVRETNMMTNSSTVGSATAMTLSKTHLELNDRDHIFLNSMRNSHLGKRCFIIGNGPSLRVEDLDRLKFEYTFASNKIYLAFEQTTWRPTYYAVEDLLVAKNNVDKITELTGMTKIFPSHMLKIIPRRQNHFYVQWIPPQDNTSPERNFSDDLSVGVCWGSTVTYTLIQYAVHMGFKEIYLIGIDHSYVEPKSSGGNVLVSTGEVNHFHPDYRKPGEKWHVPVLDRLEHSYNYAREHCDRIGVKILNASRTTKLDAFPLIKFDDVPGL